MKLHHTIFHDSKIHIFLHIVVYLKSGCIRNNKVLDAIKYLMHALLLAHNLNLMSNTAIKHIFVIQFSTTACMDIRTLRVFKFY